MIKAGEGEEGEDGPLLAFVFRRLVARDSSMSRMARVASKPFMMGMLISVRVYGARVRGMLSPRVTGWRGG